MNENSFIKSIHRYLPSELLTWKINDQFAGGVPDAFYGGVQSVVFCEYKYRPKFPARDSSLMSFGLKPQQILWLDRLKNINVPSVVIAGCEDSVIITPTYSDLATLTKSQYLQERQYTRKQAADWVSVFCLGAT